MLAAIQLAPQFLVEIVNSVLQFFHDNAGLSWGGAIIALTVCTRAVLIPLTYRQLKSMRALQALQPQLKEIQAKFKNDKQRMQQEMMNFYKVNKVNPFASCIPLVAQLPVFFTLYQVLRTELPADIGCKAGECGSEASFLFIPDLTAKATGVVLVVLIVLYVSTQLVSGLMMSVTADKSQRMMIFALPLIFVFFIIKLPAGLILYWITTNIWTIGQQYTIQKIIPAPPVPTAAEIAAAKPPPPPPKKKKKRR
ncbi:MAG TPA: YidC/Oxa1 family membrane protein insertase [Solirubrobacterales bacterium]|nr:YidC/Oxa1 family membrane protein insertase [Solirubrobacterales bacterium]